MAGSIPKSLSESSDARRVRACLRALECGCVGVRMTMEGRGGNRGGGILPFSLLASSASLALCSPASVRCVRPYLNDVCTGRGHPKKMMK